MQVNSVQSPNFGKLRIVNSQKLVEAFNNEKLETLKMIQEVGEKIKDTKFYDLKIFYSSQKGLECALVSTKDTPWGDFSSDKIKELKPDTIKYNNLYGISRYCHSKKENEYSVWNMNDDIINSPKELAEVALLLDEAAVKKYNEQAAEEAKKILYQKEVNALTDEILKDFGE